MATVNTMTTQQSYAFLNALYEEATGQKAAIQAADTGTFVSVATTVLQTGTENVLNAISKVLTKTIFSVRPYTAKFKGIEMNTQRWGSIIRKISFLDGEEEEDQRQNLTDGSSVDQYVVKKPCVLEMRYYGETVHQRHITIFKDQLDTAFTGPEQFGSFISGVMTAMQNQIEQTKEADSRAVIINFATGKAVANNGYINVLQEYYNETGVMLTPDTMYTGEMFVMFTKWLYAYINTLTDRMAERTDLYQINVTGKHIMNHTPANKLKAYMSSKVLNNIDANVLSSVFTPEKLKMIDWEKVTFWQNINDPYAMRGKPTYLKADGTLQQETNSTQISNVIGMLFDEEALGITIKSTWMAASPFNAAGGYHNLYYHWTTAYQNDFSQKGIILYAGEVS